MRLELKVLEFEAPSDFLKTDAAANDLPSPVCPRLLASIDLRTTEICHLIIKLLLNANTDL